MGRRELVAAAVVFEGAALLLAFALGAVTDAPPFARLRLEPAGLLLGALLGTALFLPVIPLTRSDWGPLARLTEAAREIVRRFFADAGLPEFALVSAMAGVAEEALFRGVIQTALARGIGVVPGIAVASILFGLAHPVTRAYVVTATAVGALLGALLAWTGDLAAPIAAHAVYDFLALSYLARARVDGSDA